jgi:hypothetical protein
MLNLSCCRFGGHLLIVPVASIGQAGAREEPSIPRRTDRRPETAMTEGISQIRSRFYVPSRGRPLQPGIELCNRAFQTTDSETSA